MTDIPKAAIEAAAKAAKAAFTEAWGPEAQDPWPAVVRAILAVLAESIAVMTSQSERHDRTYDDGFAAGQEAMRTDLSFVLASLRRLEECTGEALEGVDAVLIRWIEADLEAPALDQHPDAGELIADQPEAIEHNEGGEQEGPKGGALDKFEERQEKTSAVPEGGIEAAEAEPFAATIIAGCDADSTKADFEDRRGHAIDALADLPEAVRASALAQISGIAARKWGL